MHWQLATDEDLDIVVSLVRQYHAFEGIEQSEVTRREAVQTLLTQDYGQIYLLQNTPQQSCGYIALCWGYSLEFGGRDAFVDEFFIVPAYRGQGWGSWLLQEVQQQMVAQGIQALHLEVALQNLRARRFYQQQGFVFRDNFQLMSWRAPKKA